MSRSARSLLRYSNLLAITDLHYSSNIETLRGFGVYLISRYSLKQRMSFAIDDPEGI